MGHFKDQTIDQGRRNFGKAVVGAAALATKPSPGSAAGLVGKFDGDTVDAKRDTKRLSKQLQAIFDYMKDGQFRTLYQISHATNIPEASASARLRDLRKERNGAHEVNKENLGGGLWQYQLVPAEPPGQKELF